MWKSSCLCSPIFLIGRSPALHWKWQIFIQHHVPLPVPSYVPHPLMKMEMVAQLFPTLEKRHISGTALVLAPVLWALQIYSPPLQGEGVNWRRDAQVFSKFPKQLIFLFNWCKKHTEMYGNVLYTTHNNHGTPTPCCLESLITLQLPLSYELFRGLSGTWTPV